MSDGNLRLHILDSILAMWYSSERAPKTFTSIGMVCCVRLMILNEKHQVIGHGQVRGPASMVLTFTLQDASQLVLLGLRLNPVESQLKSLDSGWSQVRPKVWDQKYGPRPLRVPNCLLGTLFIVKYSIDWLFFEKTRVLLTKLFLILEEKIVLRLLLINGIIVIMWDVSMLFE